jgi:hypothetical protein
MPAGRIVAAIADSKGNALALSQPVSVAEGADGIAVRPVPPKVGSDVLMVLNRPRTASSVGERGLRLPRSVGRSASDQGKPFQAKVTVKRRGLFLHG